MTDESTPLPGAAENGSDDPSWPRARFWIVIWYVGLALFVVAEIADWIYRPAYRETIFRAPTHLFITSAIFANLYSRSLQEKPLPIRRRRNRLLQPLALLSFAASMPCFLADKWLNSEYIFFWTMVALFGIVIGAGLWVRLQKIRERKKFGAKTA